MGLRLIFKRIVTDLKNNGAALLIIFILWAAVSLIFHSFCPVVLISGFPCPGCGITRAFFSLLLFRFADAFHYNPSIFLWLPLALAAIVQRYIRGRSLKPLKPLLLLVALGTIAIFIWRITHYFPGDEPMVYDPGNLFAHIHPEYDRLMRHFFGKNGTIR
ncbi:MAG: DUF2752 domain-containing protein [Lachnospiraceae bacterium]|nr:DUF2752 domain-containing protein [Lachnospiraceae bacterium]